MPVLNVDTKATEQLIKKLQTLHRSALPVSIRSALNSAAFDVKKNTMPEEAGKKFINRKPTFFKANSKVEPATGFNVGSMKATVGFIKLAGKGNSVEDLEQQEDGGKIDGRSFIPLKEARTGSSWNKSVKNNSRISDIKTRIVDSSRAKGKNDEEKFIKSAIHAGKGGWVIGNRENSKGNKFLWHVKSISRAKGRNTKIRAIRMFAVKSGRRIEVKAKKFMDNAGNKSAAIMESKFIEAAEKQISKLT